MSNKDFERPKRVWVNSPSSLQPYHNIHGKVGIAILVKTWVELHFTEGNTRSMIIDPLYLAAS